MLIQDFIVADSATVTRTRDGGRVSGVSAAPLYIAQASRGLSPIAEFLIAYAIDALESFRPIVLIQYCAFVDTS